MASKFCFTESIKKLISEISFKTYFYEEENKHTKRKETEKMQKKINLHLIVGLMAAAGGVAIISYSSYTNKGWFDWDTSYEDINDGNIKRFVTCYYYVYRRKTLPRNLRYKRIGDWDVSRVTCMDKLFSHMKDFNESIQHWNVSNVTSMESMFEYCNHFNKSLNEWDVSKVTNMSHMFYGCRRFNQPLNDWNVRSVEDMEAMFQNCFKFNQDLHSWDVRNVKNMNSMFSFCKNFNQNLDNWDVSNLESHENMFNDDFEETKRPHFVKYRSLMSIDGGSGTKKKSRRQRR